ncbi:hypothetical protein ACIOEY_27515 [Streptomyces albidoflavus]|uniref:hypothetical protein n=1 Tax=Streptomyces albidoflavus TaxID=1886 RepID=UPI00344CC309
MHDFQCSTAAGQPGYQARWVLGQLIVQLGRAEARPHGGQRDVLLEARDHMEGGAAPVLADRRVGGELGQVRQGLRPSVDRSGGGFRFFFRQGVLKERAAPGRAPGQLCQRSPFAVGGPLAEVRSVGAEGRVGSGREDILGREGRPSEGGLELVAHDDLRVHHVPAVVRLQHGLREIAAPSTVPCVRCLIEVGKGQRQPHQAGGGQLPQLVGGLSLFLVRDLLRCAPRLGQGDPVVLVEIHDSGHQSSFPW